MLGFLTRNSSKPSSSFWNSRSWLLKSSASILQTKRELCLGVLPDAIDRNSDASIRNSQLMHDLLSQLHSNINKVIPYYFIFQI